MLIGYARVSTAQQDTIAQVTKLTTAGCGRVFTEQQSGARGIRREQMQACLQQAQRGDVVVVTRIDRLARSSGDLWAILLELEAKGVGVKALEQPELNTTTPTGKLMLSVLGSFSEFERELIRARTGEGRTQAKERGIKFGRKPKLSADQVAALKVDVSTGTMTMQAIGRKYGIARNSVYRLASAD